MTRIPRSTQVARPHGPTKARRQPGELFGPANTPRQVRCIPLLVEQLDGGLWRFTQPQAPGWAAAARTPAEVVRAIRAGFTEAQIAAHARWRGHLYDQDDPGSEQFRQRKRRARSVRRCDVYDAREWVLRDDGRWVSPRGLTYPEDRQVVQRVMAARVALGLPPRPDPVNPGATTE